MESSTASRSRPALRRGWVLRGGTDGNEQLTAITGVLLIVVLAVIR